MLFRKPPDGFSSFAKKGGNASFTWTVFADTSAKANSAILLLEQNKQRCATVGTKRMHETINMTHNAREETMPRAGSK